ncbi:hypothetical protein J4207_06080 [Candidatus Woesearchaeota archaeon]|nr:hypothetical protein [Candidatus Woesearchaeota archaeon]HLC80863.1 hypothetical protein [Candidatus Nanoarchaeia archaeon]
MNKTGQVAIIEFRNWLFGFIIGAFTMLLLIILIAKGIIPIDLPFLYN